MLAYLNPKHTLVNFLIAPGKFRFDQFEASPSLMAPGHLSFLKITSE